MGYKGKLSILATVGLLMLIPTGFKLLSPQGRIDPENVKDAYDPSIKTAIFNNQTIEIPRYYLAEEKVLGDETSEQNSDKRIEVDLTKQMVYAYETDKLVYSFLVSSGTWDRTPTGDFEIWIKVRSQKMSGGSKELGTYYYLPNVPYVMFFYNDKVAKKVGYSFHGTYWHNNFGVPMSHGCINMKTEEVAQLYNWAEVGTKVRIYGKYQTGLPKI